MHEIYNYHYSAQFIKRKTVESSEFSFIQFNDETNGIQLFFGQ